MSDELLTAENKFYELNVKLEKKTKQLMREVNSVVNAPFIDSESFLSRKKTNDINTENNIRKHNNLEKKDSGIIASNYVSESTIRDFNSDADASKYQTKSKQSLDE